MGNTWIDTETTETTNVNDKSRTDDAIKDPVTDPITAGGSTSGKSTSTSGDPPDLSKVSGMLSGAFAEGKAKVEGKMSLWRPRIQKVTDPVAFMTSGSEQNGKTDYSGNYDKAISNRSSDAGFYELAKGECAVLVGEINAFIATGGLEPVDAVSLSRLAGFLTSYAALYASLQDTGMSAAAAADPSKRQALADTVRAQVMATQTSFSGVPPDLLADISAPIENAMSEIALFVDSWSTISAASSGTNASPYMWANFLQTIERYRAILNEYDQLEARGGDSDATAKMAIKDSDGNWAHTPAEGLKAADEQGGFMAMALRSYGMHTEHAEKYVQQVKGMVARVKAGEFATQEECVAEFRKVIGGGRASRLFYKQLDDMAIGHWKAFEASIEANLEKESYKQAQLSQGEADEHLTTAGEHIADRDMNAQTYENNAAFYGMDRDDIIALGQQVEQGNRQVINPNAGKEESEEGLMPFDLSSMNTKHDPSNPQDSWTEIVIDEQSGTTTTSFYAQDTAIVTTSYSESMREQWLYEQGQGSMSIQEHEYLEMDKEGSDGAYEKALQFQRKAQQELKAAKGSLSDAEEHLLEGADHSMLARKYIAEARLHASYVTSDHPALLEGLSSLDQSLGEIEATLMKNAELRVKILAYQRDLEGILNDKTANIETYNPAALKVPMPEATVDGIELTSEAYSKVTIDLSGPAWWPFFWLGGVSGEYSVASSTDAKKDGWSKAKVEAYAGIAAKLWLLEAGVKLKGFFEARKKNADGLMDTVDSGIEELGRWAYAWWYDLGSIAADADDAMKMAIERTNMVYDKLDSDASSPEQFEKTRATAGATFENYHAMLAWGLISAFSGKDGEMVSFKDAVEMANSVMPLADLQEGIEMLEGASETEAHDQIAKEKQAFTATAQSARKEAVGELALVDPGHNDPNVQFEAGVGIEGFAGLSIGKAAKVELGVSRVWYVTDGEGDEFDFDVHDKTVYKGKVTVKGVEVEVTGMPIAEGWELGLDVSIPVSSSENVSGSDAIVKLREKVQSVDAGSLSSWCEGLLAVFKDSSEVTDFFEVKTASSVVVKLGGTFKLDENYDLSFSAFKFGMATKIEHGNELVKASFEAGNMMTLESSPGDAPQE